MEINITKKEAKLLIYLLDLAGDEFSNNGCNDIDDKIYKGWTKAEKQALVKRFEDMNSKGKDYDPDDLSILNYDWAMLGYFQGIFEEAIK